MDETRATQLWRVHLAEQAGEPEAWLDRMAAEVEAFRQRAQDRRGIEAAHAHCLDPFREGPR